MSNQIPSSLNLVMKYFDEICQIPHCSGSEEFIVEYLKNLQKRIISYAKQMTIKMYTLKLMELKILKISLELFYRPILIWYVKKIPVLPTISL